MHGNPQSSLHDSTAKAINFEKVGENIAELYDLFRDATTLPLISSEDQSYYPCYDNYDDNENIEFRTFIIPPNPPPKKPKGFRKRKDANQNVASPTNSIQEDAENVSFQSQES